MNEEAAPIFVAHDLDPRGPLPKVHGFVQAQSWFQDLTPVSVDPRSATSSAASSMRSRSRSDYRRSAQTDRPPGCRFHTRCPITEKACETTDPALGSLHGPQAHMAACLMRDPCRAIADMGRSEMAQLAEMTLAEVRDLTVRFVTREATVHAVNGASFTVEPGNVLCILGAQPTALSRYRRDPRQPADRRRLSQGCSFAPRCVRRMAESHHSTPTPVFPRLAAWPRVML